jgi:hypothetical protein
MTCKHCGHPDNGEKLVETLPGMWNCCKQNLIDLTPLDEFKPVFAAVWDRKMALTKAQAAANS